MNQLADLIQRYYETFNRRDFAAYDRLFTPDCLIEAPGFSERSPAAARGFDQGILQLLPDGKIVNQHKATAGNLVMCENRFQAKGFDEAYAAIFELDGERIKRQTLHYDARRMVKIVEDMNLDVVRGMYAAFGRQDAAWIMDHLADDVSWGIPCRTGEVPAYGIRDGKPGVQAFFEAWGSTGDFNVFEPLDFIVTGEHVFCTLRYEFTVRATGKRVSNPGCAQHWTVKNGKVVRWRGWEDSAATRDAYRG